MLGKLAALCILLGLCALGQASSASAAPPFPQNPPPPPVYVFTLPPEPLPPPKPYVKGLCSGPTGLVPCEVAALWVAVANKLRKERSFEVVGRVGPFGPPLCKGGPQGTAPCDDLAIGEHIETVKAKMQVTPIANVGGAAPACVGPLGPAPCDAVRDYFTRLRILGPGGGIALNQPLQFVFSQPNMGAMCQGFSGPVPCMFLLQQRLDLFSGPLPPPGSFNLPPGNLSPQMLAQFCAGAAQFDLIRFSGCTGGRFILPPNQQAVLDCAVSTFRAQRFAECAAPEFGLRITEEQRITVKCALSASGDADTFKNCAASEVLSRALTADEKALLACEQASNGSASLFALCAADQLGGSVVVGSDQLATVKCLANASDLNGFTSCALQNPRIQISPDQRAILEACIGKAEGFATCAADALAGSLVNPKHLTVLKCAADGLAALAKCALENPDVKLSDDQRASVLCAAEAKGSQDNFVRCMGAELLGKKLSADQQRAIDCAVSSEGDSGKFASCAADAIIGNNATDEQKIVIRCAVESRGDLVGTATCAGANMFNLSLNPEAQITVQCVAATGGEPVSAAGCMASRLSIREFDKCLDKGIGGSGCFGDTNDLVGRDGLLGRTLRQLAGGPNSVINNPGQLLEGPNSTIPIWGGANSFINNPGQIFGGDNSFIRNPLQIFGGTNSAFNSPGQLLPLPRIGTQPIEAGKIGEMRVCIPWC